MGSGFVGEVSLHHPPGAGAGAWPYLSQVHSLCSEGAGQRPEVHSRCSRGLLDNLPPIPPPQSS